VPAARLCCRPPGLAQAQGRRSAAPCCGAGGGCALHAPRRRRGAVDVGSETALRFRGLPVAAACDSAALRAGVCVCRRRHTRAAKKARRKAAGLFYENLRPPPPHKAEEEEARAKQPEGYLTAKAGTTPNLVVASLLGF
jgi:hypothetical protein